MAKIKSAEDYKVKGDGTIVRIGNTNLQNNERSALDKELLDIIEVNSFSKELLAAYKGRMLANRICKKKYDKPNYKEYVEMLMVKYFPKELEKAQQGGKCLCWLYFSIGLAVITCGFGIPISAIIIWKLVIPAYNKLKEMYKTQSNI
jgi:hypothetical protein